MNKRSIQPFALLAFGLLLVLGTMPCVLGGLVWRERRQEKLNQSLMIAIHRADVVAVKQLLAQGADPSAPYRPGKQTTWQAVWRSWSRGKTKPASDNALNPVQYALHYYDLPPDAEARFRIVRLLIEAGASVHVTVPIETAQRCLLVCVINDLDHGSFKQETLRFLLRHGVDVNGRDGADGPPLIQAAWDRDEQTFKILLDAGANVQYTDANGDTALDIAACHLSPQALLWLLERGAGVEQSGSHGMTPLLSAVERDKLDNAALLLAHGANINAQNEDGETALTLACGFQYTDIVRFLLRHHASLKIKNHKGQTALAMARRPLSTFGPIHSVEARETICQRRKLLIGMLTRAAARQRATERLLEVAQAAKENIALVRKLLDAGADCEARTKFETGGEWYNALQWAAYNNHWKTVSLLVLRGADVNSQLPYGDEHYYAPLARCARNGPTDVLMLLIAHGAKVNDANNYHGQTPLLCAAEEGNLQNVRALLRHGADVHATSWSGNASALSVARDNKHFAIAALLRRLSTWKRASYE